MEIALLVMEFVVVVVVRSAEVDIRLKSLAMAVCRLGQRVFAIVAVTVPAVVRGRSILLSRQLNHRKPLSAAACARSAFACERAP
jgi:hypothetical protein